MSLHLDGTEIIWCPHQCLPAASQIYWTHRPQEAQPIVGLIYSLRQMLDWLAAMCKLWICILKWAVESRFSICLRSLGGNNSAKAHVFFTAGTV